MDRRRLLIGGAVLAGASVSGGVLWLRQRNPTKHLNLTSTVNALSGLDIKGINSHGLWSPTQVFAHLAQSIEMSMSGYPQHNSDLFKEMIGRTAFELFSRKGYMKHGLADPIPGAPALPSAGSTYLSRQRLIMAIQKFQSFEGRLAPHFAYGELSKQEYELAHVMHIDDHLSELFVS